MQDDDVRISIMRSNEIMKMSKRAVKEAEANIVEQQSLFAAYGFTPESLEAHFRSMLTAEQRNEVDRQLDAERMALATAKTSATGHRPREIMKAGARARRSFV
jgi:hypothetical protein